MKTITYRCTRCGKETDQPPHRKVGHLHGRTQVPCVPVETNNPEEGTQ